jgi:hypothetical protein
VSGRLLAALLLAAVPSFARAAAAGAPERTLSFDSGYLKPMNSNKAVSGFVFELGELASYGTLERPALKDRDDAAGAALRTGALFLYYGFYHTVGGVSFHEFGHGSRALASGALFARYFGDGLGTSGDYFSYAGDLAVHPGRWWLGEKDTVYSDLNAAGRYWGVRLNAAGNRLVDDRYGFIATAGGVNNEMFLADRLEERMFYDDGFGSVAFFPVYLAGKVAALTYGAGTNSDMGRIFSNPAYEDRGIRKGDANLADAAALLLSADTYAYLKGAYEYAARGRTAVRTPSVRGFALPGVNAYLQYPGVSYKIASGYAAGRRLKVRFGYEAVLKGGHQGEWDLGAATRVLGATLSAAVVADQDQPKYGSWSIAADRDVLERFNVRVAADRYDSRTLYGMRNSPRLRTDGGGVVGQDTQVSGRVSFRY